MRSTRLKTSTLAPIPMDMVTTAINEKSGFLMIDRSAYFKSRIVSAIMILIPSKRLVLRGGSSVLISSGSSLGGAATQVYHVVFFSGATSVSSASLWSISPHNIYDTTAFRYGKSGVVS